MDRSSETKTLPKDAFRIERPKFCLKDLLQAFSIPSYSEQELRIIKMGYESTMRTQRNIISFLVLFTTLLAFCLAYIAFDRKQIFYMLVCLIAGFYASAVYHLIKYLPRIIPRWGRYSWNRFRYIDLKSSVLWYGNIYTTERDLRVDGFCEFLHIQSPGIWFECEELVSTVLPECFYQTTIRVLWIELSLIHI